MVNCYVYTHFNFGIGHFQRAKVLSEELSNKYSTFLMSSGKKLPKEFLPKNKIKFIQLPSEEFYEFGKTKVSDPKINKKAMNNIRINTIKKLFKKNKPNIFITEYFPFSPFRLKKTLMPLIKYINLKYKKCLIISSVRDFPLSDIERKNKYNKILIKNILNKYYDAILVHAPKELSIFKNGELFYRLKCKPKIFFTGFVVETTLLNKINYIKNRNKNILLTTGGGRDGLELIKKILESYKLIKKNKKIILNIVCGPLREKEKLKKLKKYKNKENIKIHDFITGSKKVNKFLCADVIISMSGYNTIAEIYACGSPSLIFPRENSYEQIKRAKYITKKNKNSFICNLSNPNKNIKLLIERCFSLKKKSFKNLCLGSIKSAEIINKLYNEKKYQK